MTTDEEYDRELWRRSMEKGMKKADFDMRSEFFKVGVSMIVAAALLVGAGVALGTYFYKPTVNYITIQQPAK